MKFWVQFLSLNIPGMVTHAYNLRTLEVEAERSKFKAILGYIASLKGSLAK